MVHLAGAVVASAVARLQRGSHAEEENTSRIRTVQGAANPLPFGELDEREQAELVSTHSSALTERFMAFAKLAAMTLIEKDNLENLRHFTTPVGSKEGYDSHFTNIDTFHAFIATVLEANPALREVVDVLCGNSDEEYLDWTHAKLTIAIVTVKNEKLPNGKTRSWQEFLNSKGITNVKGKRIKPDMVRKQYERWYDEDVAAMKNWTNRLVKLNNTVFKDAVARYLPMDITPCP